jgi:glycosyltransferase involved in cell wall biosynthesis
MRIGVNLIPLRPGLMGGAEVYFRDLLGELLTQGQHEFVLVTADYNHDTLPADSARCRRVLFASDGAARWAGRSLGRLRGAVKRLVGGAEGRQARTWQRRAESLRDLIRQERLDLWFCPFTNLEPRICPVPAVITVHDLQHEYHPEFFQPDELAHRRRFYPESCAAADHIIAVSEFTRRCVLDRYGIEPDAVSAIWEAAGSDVDWQGGHARVPLARQKYALPGPYALYPANTWHHKNHQRLIEALAHYRDLHGDALSLVLTGVGKEGQASLEGAMERHHLKGQVRILGYVPRGDLPALYAGASCLVFPSLFEGFGIPLVEAMLAGCPIAAANVTSIPEVVGDAGLLFDPMDPSDICRALAAIVRDPEQAAELRRRGRVRAGLFSAARTAALTLDRFDRVVQDGPVRGRRPGRELITVEGVWDDHWMGREMVLALRGRTLESVEIDGQLAEVPALLPQELVARVGAEPPRVASLATPGPFSLHVPLGPEPAPSGTWEVTLTPRRTFCPMEQGLSGDSRHLSVQLLRVRARTRDGREIVKTLGLTPVGGGG